MKKLCTSNHSFTSWEIPHTTQINNPSFYLNPSSLFPFTPNIYYHAYICKQKPRNSKKQITSLQTCQRIVSKTQNRRYSYYGSVAQIHLSGLSNIAHYFIWNSLYTDHFRIKKNWRVTEQHSKTFLITKNGRFFQSAKKAADVLKTGHYFLRKSLPISYSVQPCKALEYRCSYSLHPFF